MPQLFKAKTNEGYTMKILAELLQHNIKTACFDIDDKSIRLRMMDSHRKILLDAELYAENFSIYKFKPRNKLSIGINLNHYHKMLKSIKKKDSIILFIEEETPGDLGIRVVPRENNRVTTSFIKIQNVQNLDIELPDGYLKPIIVPSNEYQKMCKDMNNIGNTIAVKSQGFFIKFLCNAGSIYSREVTFGETCGEDEEDNNNEMNAISYSQDFDTEQLSRIIKISGLNNTMQIFPGENLPLLFKSNIGNLGKISIFVKSKRQIEDEEFEDESDSD